MVSTPSTTLFLQANSAKSIPLDNYIEKRTINSEDSELTLAEALDSGAGQWTPLHRLNKLMTDLDAIHWYRIRINNPNDEVQDIVLSLAPDRLLSASSAVLTQSDVLALASKADRRVDMQPFYYRSSSRPRSMNLPLQLIPGETITLLLAVESDNWIVPNFTFMTPAELEQTTAQEINYWKVVTGIFIGMIFFILSSTIITKQRGMLWLLLYSCSSICFVPNFLIVNLLSFDITSELIARLSICAALIGSVVFFGILKSVYIHLESLNRIPNTWLISIIALLVVAGAMLPIASAELLMRGLTLLTIAATLVLSGIAYFRNHQVAACTIGLTKFILASMIGFAFYQANIGTLSDGQLELWIASSVMLEAAILEIVLLMIDSARRQAALYKSINTAKKEQQVAAIAPFLGNSRHDLRASMADVIGLSELVMEAPLDENQRKHMLDIQRSGRNALERIDQLFSAQAQEPQQLKQEPFKLSTLLSECTQYYGFRANELNREIIVELSTEAPEYWSGSHEYIRQLLMHTLEYFLAANGMGEMRIKPCNFTSKSMDIEFQLSLSAGGNQQAYSAQPDITLIEAVAEKLGGKIDIEQTQQKLLIKTRIPATANNDRSRAQYDLDLLKNRRILIVDDSETSCEVIQSYLERWDVISYKAHDFNNALAIIRHQSVIGQPIDLALIDFVMPRVNGIEASQLLRASDDVPDDLAIIIMSNAAASIDLVSVKNHGVKRVLDKPVIAHTLQLVLLEEFYFLKSLEDGWQRNEAQSQVGTATTHKILLVEDNPVSAKIVGAMLAKLSIDYVHVSSGSAALEQVRQQPFSAILMDCDLPDASGFDTTRAIRAWEQDKSTDELNKMTDSPIVIIALTAYDTDDSVQQCIEAGMDKYLSKPINLTQLNTTLNEAFALQQ